MNFWILSAAFAVYLYLLRPTILSPMVDDNVNLLLPGFLGHVLQAGLGSKRYASLAVPSFHVMI